MDPNAGMNAVMLWVIGGIAVGVVIVGMIACLFMGVLLMGINPLGPMINELF